MPCVREQDLRCHAVQTRFSGDSLESRLKLFSCSFFATSWTAAHQASLAFTISGSLLRLLAIELMMSSNHLILCHPLLLPPSVFPSFRVFSYESVLPIRWPKYWSFSFSIRPSNEHSGLISFRMDWFYLHAVQGTLSKGKVVRPLCCCLLAMSGSFGTMNC